MCLPDDEAAAVGKKLNTMAAKGLSPPRMLHYTVTDGHGGGVPLAADATDLAFNMRGHAKSASSTSRPKSVWAKTTGHFSRAKKS